MNIHEEEDKLFDDWKEKRKDQNDFVEDGVVCETAYLKSDPKIAIILKEPHGDNGGDIRNWLRNIDSSDRTWDTVARWVYGIRYVINNKAIPDWNEMEASKLDSGTSEEFKEFKIKNIKSICAMNLKKVPGGGSANDSEIADFADEYANLIGRQYDLYKPDLTICCGIGPLFKEVIGHGDKELKKTTRGISYWTWDDKKHVVDFYHPARPIEHTLKLYPLIDAINEIYNS